MLFIVFTIFSQRSGLAVALVLRSHFSQRSDLSPKNQSIQSQIAIQH